MRSSINSEGDQEEHAAAGKSEHARAGPAHRMVAVGPDPVGDRDHDQDQADGEGDVARPVDLRAPLRTAQLTQLHVGPDGSEQTDGHRDQEDQAPVDGSEQAAQDQSDEHAADADDVVDPERHAALVPRECVGEDRRRVGQQEGAANPLEEAQDHEVGGAGGTGHPVDREQQRRHRVDHESEVVDAHPAEHVAESPEADDQHARDDQIAEHHPQQVEAVARCQRVQLDAAEDVRHRDDRDRAVERREQNRECRIRQRDPFVVARQRSVAVFGRGQPAWHRTSISQVTFIFLPGPLKRRIL